MEKVFKNKPVVDENGHYSGTEQIELDSIKTVIAELNVVQLKWLLSIIQFQQNVNNLFFDDDSKYEAYQDEADKAFKEYLKIKEPKDVDLKKCEKTIGKSLEDYCDVNGKSLVLEMARKLCKGEQLRNVVNWTFSINEVFADDIYDWMY